MPVQEYDTTPDPVASEAAPEAEVTAPVAGAEAEQAPATEQAPESAPEVGTASPMFTVTVDGETFEVSAQEAIAGYQRQADYTRKTQAVAQTAAELESQREQSARAQQLWDAIENNPEKTITAIAQAYGLKLTPAEAAAAQQQQAAQASEFDDFFEESPQAKPTEDPRWDAVTKFMQEQTQRDQTAAIEAELSQVRERYGIKPADTVKFNGDLVQYAVDNDIGSLDAAFRAMSFEAAQQEAARRRTAGRKQELPPVAGGHPVQAGVLAAGAGSALPSFEEAFAAAQAELDS